MSRLILNMENESNPNNAMETKSILDQIITNHQVEEVAKLDAVEIANNLFSELNERERDVLSRRFGLTGGEKETLENIGNVHKLTRERIRQIETSGVKKLRVLVNLEEYVNSLRKVINQLLEEHGGLMEKEYLLNNLVNISAGGLNRKNEDIELHKNHLDFLISRLLHDYFEEVMNSKYFKNSFKLKHQTLDHLETMAEELLLKVREAKKIFNTEDLLEMIMEMDSFKANKEKLASSNVIDISNLLGNELFKENSEAINNHKPLYSILQALKQLEQNKFGQWGINDWKEINPKTINDKIYLVLKNNGKPMHFVDITKRINEIGFDEKKANAATVHNELILDKKYVLVGRGLYSLQEWGYKNGTVVDVIKDILKESDQPLSREKIIEKVLEQRLVKKATIILALMDKNAFEKIGDKYQLKK